MSNNVIVFICAAVLCISYMLTSRTDGRKIKKNKMDIKINPFLDIKLETEYTSQEEKEEKTNESMESVPMDEKQDHTQ